MSESLPLDEKCSSTSSRFSTEVIRNPKIFKTKPKPRTFHGTVDCAESPTETLVESYNNNIESFEDQTLNVMKENQELKKCCIEQEFKIKSLKKNINDLNDAINYNHIDLVGKSSTLISNKIIELSKRNRNLYSEMEMYKTKCSELEKKIEILKKDLETARNLENQDDSTSTFSVNEIKILKDRLSVTKCKVYDLMNQNTNLRNEVKLAHKCIQQELGTTDPINLTNLVNNGTTWRGRAQQILTLQAKCNELSKQLEKPATDDLKTNQKQLELIRKREVEAIQKENEDLKNTINNLKFKITAAKTRNKNLNEEVLNFKNKWREVTEESKKQSNEIKELNDQITKIRKTYENCATNLYEQKKCIDTKSKDAVLNDNQVLCETYDKNSIITGKETKMDELQTKMDSIQHDLNELSGDFMLNCEHLRKDKYMNILENLTKERSFMVVHIEKLCTRLYRERQTVDELQKLINKLKFKSFRLENNLRNVVRELEEIRCKKHTRNQMESYNRTLNNTPNSSVTKFEFNECEQSLNYEEIKLKLTFSDEYVQFLKTKMEGIIIEKDNDIKELLAEFKRSSDLIFNTLGYKLAPVAINNLEAKGV